MHDSTTWVGMDVHKDNLSVAAVTGASGNVISRWDAPNTAKGQQRLARQLRELGNPRCVYEAGPCGYTMRRFLEAQGIPCDVVAPSLIPTKPGDRVKTDRRDAEKLARLHRAGELTTIYVPTPAQEALRDLVRSREDAKEDLLRRRHRLGKFLLRQGRRYEGRAWTKGYWRWIRTQRFEDNNLEAVLAEDILAVEQEMERVKRLDERIEEESHKPELAGRVARLRTMRGIDTLTAMTLLSELVDMNRIRQSPGVDGLRGPGSARTFQRRAGTSREHHQDRQRPSSARLAGVGLALSSCPSGDESEGSDAA